MYFVTLCTIDRHGLLWEQVGATFGRPSETVPLSDIGKIVDAEIQKIGLIYENVQINKYIIMPNHVHMIIVLHQNESGRPKVAPTISRIVQQFKGSISKKAGFCIWQKLFFDRIIRNEKEYRKIWAYIDTNPMTWKLDTYYIP